MQSNSKLILTVSFSIFMIGLSFVSHFETNQSGRKRGLASAKKKECNSLFKFLIKSNTPKVEISKEQYARLYTTFQIDPSKSDLKDNILRHGILLEEYKELQKLKGVISKALGDISGNTSTRKMTAIQRSDVESKIDIIVEDSLTYVHSCRGHASKKQSECLKLMESVIFDNAKTPYTKRFLHVKNKTKNYRKKMTREETITIDINKKVLAYKTVRLACTSKRAMGNRRAIAGGYFLSSIAAGELIANTTTYVFNNQEDDVDREWLEAMVTDVLFNTAFGFTQALMLSIQSGVVLTTTAEYLIRAGRDIPAMLTYSKYLAPSQEELEKRARELMENHHFKKLLESLLKKLEDKRLTNFVNEEIQRYAEYGDQKIPKEIKEAAIDRLTEVLAEHAYISEAKGIFKLGDLGHDYYAFNRMWDVGSTVATVALSAQLLKFMCINQYFSMKKKAGMAMTIYAVAQLVEQGIYQASTSD
jgi:hypothetical protein